MEFLTCHMNFGLEYLATSSFFLGVLAFFSVPCSTNCYVVLGILAHMTAPLHTRSCLSPPNDELKLDRSMLGFWGRR
jgi:hypothetical protein